MTLQFSSLRNTRHHSLEPMSQLENSIPGFQYTTFLQRLLKQFQTAMIYKSPSHKNVRNISKSSQVKLVLVQTQNNQLAGVTSLYQTSRLVTRLFKNEMIHSNSFYKILLQYRTTWNLLFHLQKQFFAQRHLLIVPNHRGEQNVLLDFSAKYPVHQQS